MFKQKNLNALAVLLLIIVSPATAQVAPAKSQHSVSGQRLSSGGRAVATTCENIDLMKAQLRLPRNDLLN